MSDPFACNLPNCVLCNPYPTAPALLYTKETTMTNTGTNTNDTAKLDAMKTAKAEILQAFARTTVDLKDATDNAAFYYPAPTTNAIAELERRIGEVIAVADLLDMYGIVDKKKVRAACIETTTKLAKSLSTSTIEIGVLAGFERIFGLGGKAPL